MEVGQWPTARAPGVVRRPTCVVYTGAVSTAIPKQLLERTNILSVVARKKKERKHAALDVEAALNEASSGIMLLTSSYDSESTVRSLRLAKSQTV